VEYRFLTGPAIPAPSSPRSRAPPSSSVVRRPPVTLLSWRRSSSGAPARRRGSLAPPSSSSSFPSLWRWTANSSSTTSSSSRPASLAPLPPNKTRFSQIRFFLLKPLAASAYASRVSASNNFTFLDLIKENTSCEKFCVFLRLILLLVVKTRVAECNLPAVFSIMVLFQYALS